MTPTPEPIAVTGDGSEERPYVIAGQHDPRLTLDCPMDPDDNEARAATVQQYLCTLLLKLWRHQDRFDSKRPFGHTEWAYEIYWALLQNGLIAGQINPDGFIDHLDDEDYAAGLVEDAIHYLSVRGIQPRGDQ